MEAKKKLTNTLMGLALYGAVAGCVSAHPGHGGPCPYGDDCYMGGPGMMGPGMMGQGMMGPGMRSGMMGPGMMGHGWMGRNVLDLDSSQRKKIRKIQEDLHDKHWEQMGKLNDEYAKLQDLYSADKRDPDKIVRQQQRIDELRRDMLKESIDAQNRMEEVLKPEQKKKWREYSGEHGWMMW